MGNSEGRVNHIQIESVIKYEGTPTLFGLEVAGSRMLMTAAQLRSQNEFITQCMEKINRCPSPMPIPRWHAYIDSKIREADIIPSPEDASPAVQDGVVGVYLEDAVRVGVVYQVGAAGIVYDDVAGYQDVGSCGGYHGLGRGWKD